MAKKTRVSGGSAIRAIFADAQAELAEIKPIFDPPPSEPRNGVKPGKWDGAPWDKMPPNCPITVLGKKGDTVYIISAIGELHAVSRWDHATLMSLFAPFPNYAYWAWPNLGDGGKDPETGEPLPQVVKRLERDRAINCIMAEAGRRGIFDPNDNVRGRGGWKADGNFIWHSGKHLWSVSTTVDTQTNRAKAWQIQQAKPGEYDGYFYAQDADTLQPWREPVDVYSSPAHELLQLLQTWNWDRPYLDPILHLGCIGAGYLSGALDVRPINFVMGSAGSGKSTLHAILRELYGSALHSTANTTAAGIYQHVGHDSRPVAIDEFERQANGQKEKAIIELARQAYSGAKGFRGGASGEGTEFELRSPFFFSAILHPHFGVQDRTRMIILNLGPLQHKGGSQPVIKSEWGRMLLRQMMDGWHDFIRHDGVLAKWRTILASRELGFDARAIDTYGTVLACAEILVGEQGMIRAGLPADAVAHGVGKVQLDEDMFIETLKYATAAERADQMPKWQEVLETILGAKLDAYSSGERMTIGGVIEALERMDFNIEQARARLALAGIGIRDKGKPCKGYALAIPVSDDNLNRLFGDKEFNHGGWTLALRQAPDEVVPKKLTQAEKTVKINRAAKVCTLVDLAGYDGWVAE